MQEINRKYPNTKSKLSGEYLRIFASTSDEHRDITEFLKEKGEQFFAFHPIDLRPQKVVIKGLPISTDICDIQKDITEGGFLVNKVAQLTKTKSKFKLPVFMVELQKSPDSPDIFKLLPDKTGHLANSHRCVKFPKVQPKKGESSQNRNKPIKQNTFEPSTAKVQNNLTFASALKGKQQMAPPLDKSESANSKPDATPAPKKKDNQ
ncbi:nucleic-acid-binding protein from transposon X-element [Trichonephila clavipes]|nr:nucleic-acid-binding protein from transposon X-element [Trichonephila clavipes]